jgi:Outer membrane protein beta-barrel domain
VIDNKNIHLIFNQIQLLKTFVMKKTILTAVICTVAIFLTNAQKPRIGFTAGTIFSNYTAKLDGETDNANSVTGITAGVLLDLPLSKNFSFQPALDFVQKGTKDEETYMGITEKYKLTNNTIELPLNFLYNSSGHNGNFFIGAGPSFAFSLSGKVKYDDGTDSYSEDIEFGSSDDDDLKGLDFGANFLTGYRFLNGLQISAHYNAGLSNLSPGDSGDGTLKSHYFGIKLGFVLKGKK